MWVSVLTHPRQPSHTAWPMRGPGIPWFDQSTFFAWSLPMDDGERNILKKACAMPNDSETCVKRTSEFF